MVADAYRPLPDFLVPAFDAEALERFDTNVAVIDAAGTVLWVNPAWRRFARENGAEGEIDDDRCYFDSIAPPLREFYREAFAEALATGRVFDTSTTARRPRSAASSTSVRFPSMRMVSCSSTASSPKPTTTRPRERRSRRAT